MKIIGVGLNYRDHAREVELKLLKQPLLFAKWQRLAHRRRRDDCHPAARRTGRLRGRARRRDRRPRVCVENGLEAVAG